MGGRSSSFRTDEITGIKFSNDVKFEPLIDAENDSISERNNDYIDFLQDKRINVCISTDNFNSENINPNIKKVYEITKRFNGISKGLRNSQLDIRGAKFSGPTVACFSYNPRNKDDMTIFLSSKLEKLSRGEIENDTKIQVDNKFWAPSDKEEFINKSVAHEYGHFVQKLIFEKQMDKNSTSEMTRQQIDGYERMLALKCKQDILKIQKERFNDTNDFISHYGSKSNYEFFAETFSNLVTCKKPTTLAKSLEIYIKENL